MKYTYIIIIYYNYLSLALPERQLPAARKKINPLTWQIPARVDWLLRCFFCELYAYQSNSPTPQPLGILQKKNCFYALEIPRPTTWAWDVSTKPKGNHGGFDQLPSFPLPPSTGWTAKEREVCGWNNSTEMTAQKDSEVGKRKNLGT